MKSSIFIDVVSYFPIECKIVSSVFFNLTLTNFDDVNVLDVAH